MGPHLKRCQEAQLYDDGWKNQRTDHRIPPTPALFTTLSGDHFFGSLETALSGVHSCIDEEVQHAVQSWLHDKPSISELLEDVY
jgi:hypothetical protein